MPRFEIIGVNRRERRFGGLVLAIGLVVTLPTTSIFEAQEARPNVLFIASDDLNIDMGVYGHPIVKTPNLDRLAGSGLRFDAAYVQTPVCTPSRSSFLTGLYPNQTGVTGNQRTGNHFRDTIPEVITLPQLFRENGYYTARVGKIFHYRVPYGIGTDGLDDPKAWDERVNPQGIDRDDEVLDSIEIIDPTAHERGAIGATLGWKSIVSADSTHTDAMVADEAITLLEANNPKETGKPFFLGVGFFRPHVPYIAPQKYFDMYPLDQIELATNLDGHRHDIPIAALSDNRGEAAMSVETEKTVIQAYYATITFMDVQLGRVLDTLNELGLRENTIVVFLSDHGYSLGEHDLWQKGNLFEKTVKTPLIIDAPAANYEAATTTSFIEFVDLYPSLAEMAKLTAPPYLAGRSFTALFDDPNAEIRSSAYSQQFSRASLTRAKWQGNEVMGHSIRTRRYRYTEWNGGSHGIQLYDFESDPDEFDNLADEPDYLEVLQSMQVTLRQRTQEASTAIAF